MARRAAEAASGASARARGRGRVAGVALVGRAAGARRASISLGQLIAAAGVTQFLVGPLSRLAWVGAWSARAPRASAERLSAALAAPPGARRRRRGAGTRRDVGRASRSAGCGTGRSTGSTSTSRPEPCTASPQPTRRQPRRCWTASGREVAPAGGSIAIGGVELAALGPAAARAALIDEPARRRAARRHGARERRRGRGRGRRRGGARTAAAAVEDVLAALPHGDATRLDDGGRLTVRRPAPADRAGARARGARAGARAARADDRARRRDRGARGGRADARRARAGRPCW